MRRASLALDAGSVIVFVVIGRHAHSHGETVAGIVSTAWPFAVGLLAGRAVLAWRRTEPAPVRPGGLVVWLSTVAIGMVLRVIAGQGTAVAFVVVALAFLGATMLGGRAVAGILRTRTTPV